MSRETLKMSNKKKPGAAATTATADTTKPEDKNPASNQKIKCIGVTSRPDTFRRAGYAFNHEEKVIEMAALNAVQLKQLRAEGVGKKCKLTVRELTTTPDKIHIRADERSKKISVTIVESNKKSK